MDTRTKIRLLRIAKGLNQDDLAKRSGIAVYYISAIESNAIARIEQRLLETLGYTVEMDAMLATLAGKSPAETIEGAGT